MSTVSRMTLLDVGGLPNDTLFYIDGLPNETLFYVDGLLNDTPNLLKGMRKTQGARESRQDARVELGLQRPKWFAGDYSAAAKRNPCDP